MKKLCVFCGAQMGKNPAHVELTKQFGQWMAKNNIALVYGGGHTGLMGVIADSVLANGGYVIGVIPDFLVKKEMAHSGLQELYEVKSMHERKYLMASKSDGFIALPGGFGTLDELNEIITWAQIGEHKKPVAILNKTRYFDLFIDFVRYAQNEGFIQEKFLKQIQIIDEASEFSWNGISGIL